MVCAKRPFVAFKSVNFVVSFHLHSKIGILKVNKIVSSRKICHSVYSKLQSLYTLLSRVLGIGLRIIQKIMTKCYFVNTITNYKREASKTLT